jgi:hypothetical protein
MRKVIFLVTLLAVRTTTFAQSMTDSDRVTVMRDGNSVLMIPADFTASETYLVVQRHQDVAVVPYPSAEECGRFAAELGGRCLSGAYVIQHRGERLF